MKRVWGWLKTCVDIHDLFTFGGLGLTCYGLYLIYPPAAFVVGGTALFWLGVR